MDSYSLCGMTQTTSSTAVMEGVYNLRASPQAEWDAIICTSHAVHSAMEYQFECADDFLMHRFGSVPPRPQLPVVPLGINSADFRLKPDLRRAYRQEMGWTEDDIVVSIVARLSPYAKFDPYLCILHCSNLSRHWAPKRSFIWWPVAFIPTHTPRLYLSKAPPHLCQT